MDIRTKLYPYPVLAYYTDDYKNSEFDVNITIQQDGYNVLIDFVSTLDNPQIVALIKQEKAGYAFHLECAQTGYRKVISTKETIKRISLSSKDVRGTLQICPFIVAKQDLKDYSNDLFHEDYQGMKFAIDTGCVMAIGKQVNAVIQENNADFSNVPSIFSIIYNADEATTQMIVDAEQNKIVIKLTKDDYHYFKSLNKNSFMHPILYSFTVIPALTYALEWIKHVPLEDRSVYDMYGWYRAVKKALLDKFKCDVESEEFNDKNSLILAQKLINEPIHAALNRLNNLGSNEGEYI
jgi:hypothetical protein